MCVCVCVCASSENGGGPIMSSKRVVFIIHIPNKFFEYVLINGTLKKPFFTTDLFSTFPWFSSTRRKNLVVRFGSHLISSIHVPRIKEEEGEILGLSYSTREERGCERFLTPSCRVLRTSFPLYSTSIPAFHYRHLSIRLAMIIDFGPLAVFDRLVSISSAHWCERTGRQTCE
jgi:hypothetical protein